jgi:hypothetical protein
LKAIIHSPLQRRYKANKSTEFLLKMSLSGLLWPTYLSLLFGYQEGAKLLAVNKHTGMNLVYDDSRLLRYDIL